VEFLHDATSASNVVSGARVERMKLESRLGDGDQVQRALGTGFTEDLPAQLVLTSIGYASVPVDGTAFDEKTGTIPNELGQALFSVNGTTDFDPGLFVCGWLKRGPTGIIGTNLIDAEQTVDTIVRQKDTLPAVRALVPGSEGLLQLLASRNQESVSFGGWKRIDEEERRRGEAIGKPREKITAIDDMLRGARGEQ